MFSRLSWSCSRASWAPQPSLVTRKLEKFSYKLTKREWGNAEEMLATEVLISSAQERKVWLWLKHRTSCTWRQKKQEETWELPKICMEKYGDVVLKLWRSRRAKATARLVELCLKKGTRSAYNLRTEQLSVACPGNKLGGSQWEPKSLRSGALTSGQVGSNKRLIFQSKYIYICTHTLYMIYYSIIYVIYIYI